MVKHKHNHIHHAYSTVYHAYKIAGGCSIALYNQENKKLYIMSKIKHYV